MLQLVAGACAHDDPFHPGPDEPDRDLAEDATLRSDPNQPPRGHLPMAKKTKKKAAKKKATKKKATKRKAAKKKKPVEMIISKSRTKNASGINVSGDFYAALDGAVRDLIATAEARATANGRKTLRPQDL